jgi:hypothetical protein
MLVWKRDHSRQQRPQLLCHKCRRMSCSDRTRRFHIRCFKFFTPRRRSCAVLTSTVEEPHCGVLVGLHTGAETGAFHRDERFTVRRPAIGAEKQMHVLVELADPPSRVNSTRPCLYICCTGKATSGTGVSAIRHIQIQHFRTQSFRERN